MSGWTQGYSDLAQYCRFKSSRSPWLWTLYFNLTFIFVNPFLFIKVNRKRLFISWEGFYALEKNDVICSQRVMLPINSKKVCQTSITICRGLSHLTRSLSRIVCRGQKGPKGSEGTLRPDFQAYARPWIFLKPMSPQDTGRKSRYS